MEASTLTVHWHDDNQPIYSVDFQPSSSSRSERLVTGGGDNNIRIWKLTDSNTIEYLSTLHKHSQAVNVVRFNHSGDILASAGDDGTLLLWTKSNKIIKNLETEDDEDLKESWTVIGTLRSSTAEIMDICWSPNDGFIVTGSMDNVLRVYKLQSQNDKITGVLTQSLANHTHYIQGVYWDPLDSYIVSQSADRSVNIYSVEHPSIDTVEVKFRHKFYKFRNLYLYCPETLQSFFRRLCFSPDGSLLITPAGLEESTDDNNTNNNVLYIYSRTSLFTSPIYKITGLSKPAIAVSFSPIKYKLNGESTIKVPYKLVFAVALQDGVVIYSTQDNFKPLGFVSNLHYSSITDLKWDNDGSRIIISSTDGFCSHVVFEKDVFGEPCEDQTFAVPTTTTITSEPEKVSSIKNEADEIVVDEVPKEPEPPKTNNDNTPSIDSFFGKNQKVKKRIAPTLIQQ